MSEMKKQIKDLLELQDVDNHLRILVEERDQAPLRVAQLEKLRDQQKETLDVLQAEQSELEARRQELQKQIDDNARKTGRSQKRLSEIKNVRQHKAMLKEIEDLRLAKDDLEEEILGVLEGLEEVTPKVEKVAPALEETAKALEAEKAELDATVDKMNSDIERLTKERAENAAKIAPELLGQYEFISKRLNEAAVAPVLDGTCQICHMRLTPQQSIELRQMTRMMNCPNCQRIIYWAGEED